MTTSKIRMEANKFKIIAILLIFANAGIYGQSNVEIKNLLKEIGEQTTNSKEIKNHKSANRIMNFGSEIIPTLVKSFSNNKVTEIFSECQERNLTEGEIAMILADRIEFMPYAKITGLQNCLMTFCGENDNLIEYYFRWDEDFTIDEFTKNYLIWLESKERKDWKNSVEKSKLKRKKN